MVDPLLSHLLSPKMLGYWSDDTLQEAPDASAVFCVFRVAKDPESGDMRIQELLYIGEHRSARYGLQHHPERDKWQAYLHPGEVLWYSAGLVGQANRERLAAAMIHAHKPRFNGHSEYLERFPFDETMVHIYGQKDKLQSVFTVYPQS